MTYIEGTVIEIIYKNEENSYTVLDVECEGNLITCVGNLPYIQPGEYVRFYGAYTTHRSYGEQFKVAGMESRLPEEKESIKLFLSGGLIKGVGEVLASRIVDEFGEETFSVIEDSPELLANIKGISLKLALNIHDQCAELVGVRSAVGELQAIGLTLNQALRAWDVYGMAARELIEQNPYRLVDDVAGIGFERADRIAAGIGMENYTEKRLLAGICYVLKKQMENGHTCLPKDVLLHRASDVLESSLEDISDAYNTLMMKGTIAQNIFNGVEAAALSNVYTAESYCAYRLAMLACSTPEKAVDPKIMNSRLEEGIKLSEEQERAVISAAMGGVTVITGGPGTGKTTILKELLGIFENCGMETALAAPTGRAAKRMEQATGRSAKTIHRLLEYGAGSPEEDEDHSARFTRNEDNPLEADAIIIDETSMVDIFLLRSLLAAIPQGTRLVLVGDADQLPSVGPGNVLKDIIKSGVVSVCRLTHIYRQTGNIAMNAHRINAGEMPELFSSGDFVFIPTANPEDTMEAVRNNYLHEVSENGEGNVQIICPVRKGLIGVHNINTTIREHVNPRLFGKEESNFGDTLFREGDKVMQIVNNYSKEWRVQGILGFLAAGIGVFNGDMGRIEKIDNLNREFKLVFDGERAADYEFSEWDQIDHSYAVTVHKSQGSEFDTVILPLFYGRNSFLTRNLLYTAVTRAKRKVIVIGLKKTIQYMVENNKIAGRYTCLDHELKRYSDFMCNLSNL